MSSDETELLDALERLLTVERADPSLLVEVTACLMRGHTEYGPLHVDSDSRDFATEAREELQDCLVYLMAEVMRRDRSGQSCSDVFDSLVYTIRAWTCLQEVRNAKKG